MIGPVNALQTDQEGDRRGLAAKKLLRRLRILVALLLLSAVAAAYLLVPLGQPLISQATCDKIQIGWSDAQVEELLGESSIRIPHVGAATVVDLQGPATDFDSFMQWMDDEGNQIQVFFDARRRVIQKLFGSGSLSFRQRIERRVERRVRALWPRRS
jgi:hypothetical protein